MALFPLLYFIFILYVLVSIFSCTLQWRHNGRDSASNHQPHDCLLNHLFRRRPKKTSKLHVTGLCADNSPVTGEFPAEMASNMENVSISWRYHTSLHLQTMRPVELQPKLFTEYRISSIVSNFLFLLQSSLSHSDATWCYRSWWTLVHIMDWFLFRT